MKDVCKFSVLRYVPNECREEFINIGLVIHSPSQGFVDFKSTTNFSRVTAFDDEIDLEFLKLVIAGIKEEFSQSTVHGPSLRAVNEEDFLEKQTMFYANQLQFSPIRIIRSDNPKKDLENLFKTYVYFDVKKNKRISDDEVRKIMSRVFQKSELHSKLDKNYIFNIETEDVILDYSYRSKDNNNLKFIKTFSFDYSNKRSKIATQIAKEWAWNFIKISEDRINISKNELLTVVYATKEDENIDNALNILGENSNILPVKNEENIEKVANEILKDIN